MKTRSTVLAGATSAAVVLALCGCADLLDSRKGMDIQSVLGPDTYLVQSEADVRDTTTSVCATLSHCVQAAESDRVRIIRFADKDAAAEKAGALGNAGHHSDWFVVEFLHPEDTSQRDRLYVTSSVDGTWSDSPD